MISSFKDVFFVLEHQLLQGAVVNLAEVLSVGCVQVQDGAAAQVPVGAGHAADHFGIFARQHLLHSRLDRLLFLQGLG